MHRPDFLCFFHGDRLGVLWGEMFRVPVWGKGDPLVPPDLYPDYCAGLCPKIKTVWAFADIANGLMAIPNLIALICLSGVLVLETNEFLKIVAEEG